MGSVPVSLDVLAPIGMRIGLQSGGRLVYSTPVGMPKRKSESTMVGYLPVVVTGNSIREISDCTK